MSIAYVTRLLPIFLAALLPARALVDTVRWESTWSYSFLRRGVSTAAAFHNYCSRSHEHRLLYAGIGVAWKIATLVSRCPWHRAKHCGRGRYTDISTVAFNVS